MTASTLILIGASIFVLLYVGICICIFLVCRKSCLEIRDNVKQIRRMLK